MSKNNQNSSAFNDNIFNLQIRGMLASANVLIDFNNLQGDRGDPEALIIGNQISIIMISSFCAELLLKYKITQEGKSYERDHNLHKLYNKLSGQSKTSIEREFNKHKSKINLPQGYDSAESILSETQDDFVNWRYVAQSPNRMTEITTSYPLPIYIAAVSVYETTPLAKTGFIREEITEEYLRENNISEEDLRKGGIGEKIIKKLFEK